MKRILLRTFTIIFAVVIITGLAMPVMSADKPLKWRMATLYPRGTAFCEVYEAFCDNVKALSGGRLTISMVYDGEGVPATEVLSATRSGLVEMGSPYQALQRGVGGDLRVRARSLDGLWSTVRDGATSHPVVTAQPAPRRTPRAPCPAS